MLTQNVPTATASKETGRTVLLPFNSESWIAHIQSQMVVPRFEVVLPEGVHRPEYRITTNGFPQEDAVTPLCAIPSDIETPHGVRLTTPSQRLDVLLYNDFLGWGLQLPWGQEMVLVPTLFIQKGGNKDKVWPKFLEEARREPIVDGSRLHQLEEQLPLGFEIRLMAAVAKRREPDDKGNFITDVAVTPENCVAVIGPGFNDSFVLRPVDCYSVERSNKNMGEFRRFAPSADGLTFREAGSNTSFFLMAEDRITVSGCQEHPNRSHLRSMGLGIEISRQGNVKDTQVYSGSGYDLQQF